MPNDGFKSWCFTLNNPKPSDLAWCDLVCRDCDLGTDLRLRKHIELFVVQTEYAPGTGTVHLQGYVRFTDRINIASSKLRLGFSQSPHLERAKGDAKSNFTYCTKGDDIWRRHYGQFPYQGQRFDLERGCEVVRTSGIDGLYSEAPQLMVKYGNGFNRYAAWLLSRAPVRSRQKPRVVFIWGSTGTGKSRLAFSYDAKCYSVPCPSNGSFYAYGYDPKIHKTVVFDDMRDSWLRLDLLLKLLDRYPCTVNTCGGSASWEPEVIYITSNIPLSRWYTKVPDASRAALSRRIDEIIHMDEFSVPNEDIDTVDLECEEILDSQLELPFVNQSAPSLFSHAAPSSFRPLGNIQGSPPISFSPNKHANRDL